MAPLNAFTRIAATEAKIAALVKIVHRQAGDIQLLQAKLAAMTPRLAPANIGLEPIPLARSLSGMAEIAELVAAAHMLTVADLRSPIRTRAIAWPRQEAMRLMLDAGYSTTQVGRFLGGRDHTTVIHGARAARLRDAA